MNHNPLNQIIQAQIHEKDGFLSFAEFMNLALYAPEAGYYQAKAQLGMKGDFVTAPEISPLFGECLATAIAPILKNLPDGVILEFGPGTGKLAASLLIALQKIGCLPKNYYLMEVSAALRAEQQATLAAMIPEYLPHITWLDRLPAEPLNGVVIANEVLDAMPVERFSLHAQQIWQMGVKNPFEWDYRLAPDTLKTAIQEAAPQLVAAHLLDPTQRYESEIQLNLLPWLRSIHDFLDQGIVLLIDYGFESKSYYHPDRRQGTLMCHYQQRTHSNPFWHIGEEDITAHVNFTEVAKAAEVVGFNIVGYTHQAYFLLDAGLLEKVSEITDPKARLYAQQAVKLLTLPQEMGELFKVMMLSRPSGAEWDEELIGFRLRDFRYQL